jgi:hypothetical protein
LRLSVAQYHFTNVASVTGFSMAAHASRAWSALVGAGASCGAESGGAPPVKTKTYARLRRELETRLHRRRRDDGRSRDGRRRGYSLLGLLLIEHDGRLSDGGGGNVCCLGGLVNGGRRSALALRSRKEVRH